MTAYAKFRGRNHPSQVATRGAIDSVDDRRVPQALFDEMHGRFAFTLDACASAANRMLSRYRSVADLPAINDWAGERVWCNPPYSALPYWVSKAAHEFATGRTPLIVMLLPATRTDQRWWHDVIEPFRDGLHPNGPTTEFLPGRIRFTRGDGAPLTKHDRPMFGCVLVIWERAA